jgi:hypothetical protein
MLWFRKPSDQIVDRRTEVDFRPGRDIVMHGGAQHRHDVYPIPYGCASLGAADFF